MLRGCLHGQFSAQTEISFRCQCMETKAEVSVPQPSLRIAPHVICPVVHSVFKRSCQQDSRQRPGCPTPHLVKLFSMAITKMHSTHLKV